MNQEEKPLKRDAIIVGAGPSGLLAATEIAASGHDVCIFEEHDVIGEPDHCAGLLSSTGLKRLGLNPPKDVVQHVVRGARIFAPNGSNITVERGKREAHVVDRREFDRWLASRATERGVKLFTGTHVNVIRQKKSGLFKVLLRNETTDIQGKIVLSAEGSKCKISSQLGFPIIPRKQKLPAFQYEVTGGNFDTDFVEMFYGRRISRGFFAWIIPLGERKARIGVASKDFPKKRLDAAIKHHRVMKERLSNITITRSMGGTVLVGKPIRETAKNRSMVLGDAAGIVKATTGGGVILGGLTSKIAGKTAATFLSDKLPDLRSYDKRWRGQFIEELRTMYYAQRAIISLSDTGLNRLIESANEFGLVNIIKREGDMDMQKKVILDIFKDPRMIFLAFRIIVHLNPFV